MKKGPDIAIMLAEKRGPKRGEGEEDEQDGDMIDDAAEDIIEAVKSEDPEMLAAILRALIKKD